MKYLKHLLIFVIACLFFILIDNVYALSESQRLSVLDTGSFVQYIYQGNSVINSNSDSSLAIYGGKGFLSLSSWPTVGSSYGLTYSYRLVWTVSGDYFKNYDTLGLTIGYHPGYVNNLTIAFIGNGYNSGWIQCTPVSLPGSGNDYGTQFSSFSCTYDNTPFANGGTYDLHVYGSAVSSYVNSNIENASPLVYSPVFNMSPDILLFSNYNDRVVQGLKEQTDAINKQTESIDKVDDSLNNTDTSGANSSANGFFDSFEDSDYGLSDVITMPLNTIKSITSATCTPLSFPLPFVNKNMSLPCMTSIYSQFGPILTIYQTITFGIVSYWVCINTYATVRKFKDPDNDEIEVVSL